MRYRALRIPAALAFLFFTFLSVFQAQAQTPSTLTPEQLRIFQSLPPEQQQAILDAMSKSSSSTSGAPQQTEKSRGEGSANSQRQEIPGEAPRRTRGPTEVPEGPPRIGPQSTILIGVELMGRTSGQQTVDQSGAVKLSEGAKALLE